MITDEHGSDNMSYYLPLRLVSVSDEVDVMATRIICLMSTKTYQARETLKAERRAGTLINACGTKAAKTAIFMDNNAIVSSPIDHKRLVTAIENSNIKGETRYHTKRLRVYDVADEEPMPEDEEQTQDVDKKTSRVKKEESKEE